MTGEVLQLSRRLFSSITGAEVVIRRRIPGFILALLKDLNQMLNRARRSEVKIYQQGSGYGERFVSNIMLCWDREPVEFNPELGLLSVLRERLFSGISIVNDPLVWLSVSEQCPGFDWCPIFCLLLGSMTLKLFQKIQMKFTYCYIQDLIYWAPK